MTCNAHLCSFVTNNCFKYICLFQELSYLYNCMIHNSLFIQVYDYFIYTYICLLSIAVLFICVYLKNIHVHRFYDRLLCLSTVLFMLVYYNKCLTYVWVYAQQLSYLYRFITTSVMFVQVYNQQLFQLYKFRNNKCLIYTVQICDQQLSCLRKFMTKFLQVYNQYLSYLYRLITITLSFIQVYDQ